MLAVALCLPACGDDPSWVPPDIDQAQPLTSIGTAGYTNLCNAFDTHVADAFRSSRLIKTACTAYALQTTQDTAACNAAVSACVAEQPVAVQFQIDQILDQASCAMVSATPAGCASPISDLVRCLDALGSAVDQLKLDLTCAAAGTMRPATSWWKIAKPAACEPIETAC